MSKERLLFYITVVSYSAFAVFGQNMAFCGPKAWFPEI